MAGKTADLALLLLIMIAAPGCIAPVEPLVGPEIALEAPLTLDLGSVARGDEVQGTFIVQNVGPSSVLLEGVQQLEGLGALGGSEVEAQLEAVVLGPEEVVEVRVRVRAGPGAAGELSVPLRVLAPVLPHDDPRLPVIEVIVRVSPSGLIAEPNPLTIGPVPYLDTGFGTVVIRNLRATPVEVFALRYANGRAQYDETVTRGSFGILPEVDAQGRFGTLGGGESIGVPIAYTAPEGDGEAKEQALWTVGSCPDRSACALTIVVQGLPDHEAPQLQLTPSGVHFGQTPVAAEVERELRISNAGQRPLSVSGFVFEGSGEFTPTLPTDVLLAPREAVAVRVLYQPLDENLDNAQLRFQTNDPSQPDVQVRVTGSGVVLPPCQLEALPASLNFGVIDVFDSLSLETSVRSTGNERCLVFDPQIELTEGTAEGSFLLSPDAPAQVTLDPGEQAFYGVIFAPGRPGRHTGILRLRTSEGAALEVPLSGRTPGDEGLSCSPARTAEVGSTISLVAALSRDATARSYRWQLLSGPMRDGRIGASFLPNADTGPEVELQTDLLGDYAVQVEVQTETGSTFSCLTSVTAVSSGLKAILTWDGPGDLDLHLHRGSTAPWFSDDDCHFDNLLPVWSAIAPAGAGPNPRLDRDDTSGHGPENLSIETPQIGRPYTLAVSHFERAQGRTATVQVFCGRASMRLQLSSRPFAGTQTGTCTRNDFWTIATIRFTAPDQCDVQTIDRYTTTRQACAAF